MRPGVTAVISAIPPRLRTHLPRALDSVIRQRRPVDAISVHVDSERLGAAVCRTRAVESVRTEWAALLDDDDEWEPDHVALLVEHAEATGADLVYPWFTIPECPQCDPWPEREGKPFDRELLRGANYVPITVLVRTELLLDAGGFTPKGPPDNPCDDWGTWERLLDAGARFRHLDRRTWLWHWHGANTSGRTDRW